MSKRNEVPLKRNTNCGGNIFRGMMNFRSGYFGKEGGFKNSREEYSMRRHSKNTLLKYPVN